MTMHKTIVTALLLLIATIAQAQTDGVTGATKTRDRHNAAQSEHIYTRHCTDTALLKRAKRWAKKGAWRNGWTAASPHASVNLAEFYTQYALNRDQWDAMFRWLATTDLTAISAGRHAIAGSTLTASVEDSENYALQKGGSESHRTHIDFQYVVRGTERFGLIEHNTSRPNCDYRPDVLHYDYDLALTRFHDSSPDRFFLFFPDDWHIAKVKTELDDQHIRVVVIKLDYIAE